MLYLWASLYHVYIRSYLLLLFRHKKACLINAKLKWFELCAMEIRTCLINWIQFKMKQIFQKHIDVLNLEMIKFQVQWRLVWVIKFCIDYCWLLHQQFDTGCKISHTIRHITKKLHLFLVRFTTSFTENNSNVSILQLPEYNFKTSFLSLIYDR